MPGAFRLDYLYGGAENKGNRHKKNPGRHEILYYNNAAKGIFIINSYRQYHCLADRISGNEKADDQLFLPYGHYHLVILDGQCNYIVVNFFHYKYPDYQGRMLKSC
jgi:hypothetical protein